MNTRARAGESNLVNGGTCTIHGPYVGLICTACVVTLPPRTGPGEP